MDDSAFDALMNSDSWIFSVNTFRSARMPVQKMSTSGHVAGLLSTPRLSCPSYESAATARL